VAKFQHPRSLDCKHEVIIPRGGLQFVGSCCDYVTGEIAPSGDGTASPASGLADASCEADATCTSNRPSTDEKRRSSSSSPRSQDGGGLFDRLLGNITGSLSMKRANSAATVSQPTCLICLENLGPDDFEVRSCVRVLVGSVGAWALWDKQVILSCS
jgi:hypothetical protein